MLVSKIGISFRDVTRPPRNHERSFWADDRTCRDHPGGVCYCIPFFPSLPHHIMHASEQHRYAVADEKAMSADPCDCPCDCDLCRRDKFASSRMPACLRVALLTSVRIRLPSLRGADAHARRSSSRRLWPSPSSRAFVRALIPARPCRALTRNGSDEPRVIYKLLVASPSHTRLTILSIEFRRLAASYLLTALVLLIVERLDYLFKRARCPHHEDAHARTLMIVGAALMGLVFGILLPLVFVGLGDVLYIANGIVLPTARDHCLTGPDACLFQKALTLLFNGRTTIAISGTAPAV